MICEISLFAIFQNMALIDAQFIPESSTYQMVTTASLKKYAPTAMTMIKIIA